MTFEEAAAVEPRLLGVKNFIEKRVAELPKRWAIRERAWYQEFKPRFVHLVGYMAENPELKSSETYDAVYRKLLEVFGE